MGVLNWLSRRRDEKLHRTVGDLAERARLGEQNAQSQLVVLGENYRGGPERARRLGLNWEQIQKAHAAALAYVNRTSAAPAFGVADYGQDGAYRVPVPDGRAVGDAIRERQKRRPGLLGRLMPWGSRGRPQDLPPNAERAIGQLAAFGAEAPGLAALRTIPKMGPGALEGTHAAVVALADRRPLRPRDLARAHEFYGHHPSFAWSVDHPDQPLADEYGYAGFVFGRAARLQAVRAGASFALLSPTMAWELGEDIVVAPYRQPPPYNPPDWEYAPPHFDQRPWDEV